MSRREDALTRSGARKGIERLNYSSASWYFFLLLLFRIFRHGRKKVEVEV